MLKLNKINLKLQDFENKYIKHRQKSVSISSFSDESISYNSKVSDAKSPAESKRNGIDAHQEGNESNKDEKPELGQKKLDFDPVVFNSPKRNDSPEILKKSESKSQLMDQLNGQWDNPNLINPTEMFIRPKIKSRPMNQSNAFDVLGNIRLITLDDLADDSSSAAALGKERSSDKIVSQPKIYQDSDRWRPEKKSSLESLDSEIKSSQNDSRSASKVGVKMNGYNTESDIVEELISPVSDIPEDVSTALSNESFSTGPSEIKTEPIRRNNKKRSTSGTTNYDYSSEFEVLSDAEKRQESGQLHSRSNHSANESAGIKAPEEVDATTDNISELDQTQSHDQSSENIKEESFKLISGPSSEEISERSTSVLIQPALLAPKNNRYSKNDGKTGVTNTGSTVARRTSKLDSSKSDRSKIHNYSTVRDDEKLQVSTTEHFSKAQNLANEIPHDDGQLKLAVSPSTPKRQKIRISKSTSKMYKTISENLNNSGDSQKNGSTGSSKLNSANVESSENNNKPLKTEESCGRKEAGMKVKRNRHFERIKNDMSSDAEMRNRNKSAEPVQLKQDFTASLKNSESLLRGKRGLTNLKSVNTQTSPKVVCFEEPPRFETFEEKFKTSRENICSCCAKNSAWLQNSTDFRPCENHYGRLEIVMNRLLMGQLKFIQNMVERQARSHELNRQIIQQMRLLEPNFSHRT